MSCVVRWQPAQDHVYSESAVPSLFQAKKLSSSLGDLTKETRRTRSLGVTLGTYIITPSKKMKARAPPPPMHSTSKSHMDYITSSEPEVIGSQNLEESKENRLHKKMALTVCLPDGQEKHVTVDGSKAVMDFLVDLCSQHHLNPAQHTLEVRSGVSQQPFTLRPNTLIGTLDVETVFMKEKVTEGKLRKPPPKIPEKTVRLVVNFLGTQKAVVRVNPAAPLWNILPAVCEKCELNNENVTLLRDAINREELDMSRSLNELGIKELYVWGSKQEKNRNLSSNSDTTEEKRGILGFFRSHKKGNKSERSLGNVDSEDYEEVFRTASTSGNRYEGFLTAPSSPSVTSRPIALGASLSLSNISGIGSKTEMKKRRAPPPPMTTAPTVAAEKTVTDMTTEQQYATVQKEQQKKKRRAPPPPTSQMPNEKYEDLENPKSSTSNERQVPQKPPRGNSRSPPQFMIPPPPSYPPPDNGIVELPVLENGATQTGPTRPIPAKREKRLLRCKSVSLEDILTTDDAGSVNNYPDNPGLVSGPSSSKSSTVGTQPARAETCNSEDLRGANASSLQAEDEVALLKTGDEEDFIVQQFQQTLAELDEDSEDMDDGDIGESSHIGTRSSPVGEESSHYNDSSDQNSAVPVTVIDQIPEIYTLKHNTHNIAPVKEYNKIQQTIDIDSTQGIDVLPEVDKQKNVNNITYKTHRSVSQEWKSKYVENPYPLDISINNSIIIPPQKQYIAKENLASNLLIAAPSIKVSNETTPAKEITDQIIIPEHKENIENKDNSSSNIYQKTESTKPVLWRQQTYEPKVGMTTFTVVPPKRDIKKYDRDVSLSTSAIKIDDLGNLISPHSSFDKNDVKYAFINDTEESLLEKPLLERAKEFWRSSSVESQAVESKEQTVKKLAPVIKSYKPNQVAENKLNSTQFMGLSQQMPGNKLNDTHKQMLLTKSAASQERMIIVENTSKGRTEVSFGKPAVYSKFNGIQQKNPPKSANDNMTIIESTIKRKTDLQTAGNDRPNGSQQTKPAQLLNASHEKVIIIEQPNMERKDLSFLKSSKRTSSQYVASAITKYAEPVNNKSIQTSVAKLDTNVDYRNNTLKSNGNFIAQEPKAEFKTMNTQESVDLKKNYLNSNSQTLNAGLQIEPTTKINSNSEQFTAMKRGKSLSEQNGFNGSQNIVGSTTVTKRTNIHSSPPAESYGVSRPKSGLPSNAFLKAVREKSVKIEQANSIIPIKSAPATVVPHENEEKDINSIPSTVIDEPDSPSGINIFGPKAKFRPVLQKPMQKDTSLHSALMGAIQSGEGKEKLRKIQSSPTDGDERKFAEPENERAALLSEIRAHNGMSRLKKVTSAASDELQTLRSKEMLLQDNEFVTTKASIPAPPFFPPPPPPPVVHTAPKSPPVFLNSSGNARDALLEAIRSGAGASRLKKVSASVHTL